MTIEAPDAIIVVAPADAQADARGVGAIAVAGRPLGPCEWQTPGALIARRVAGIEQVRFVAERFEGTRYAVFVVLDDDPDEALDAVFEAESDAMKALPRMAFDLRVRKPHPGWPEDGLLATCIEHYRRP